MEIPTFTQGKLYKRSAIHDQFGGSRQSGISPSRKAPAIFAFTGESGEQHGYVDTWDSSHQVFSYTGEGQLGDMTMDAGNAAIRDHVDDGRTLHLFAIASDAEARRELSNAEGRGYCRYVGEMQCAGVIDGTGPDRAGRQRKIFQFQLVRVEALEDESPELGAAAIDQPNSIGAAELRRLRDQALQAAAPAKKKVGDARRTLFERAKHVVGYALARAAGTCEACGEAAPFLRADGSPYLEVHHIDRLSDGGLDAPHRVAAICPTCHRRIHCGADGSAINDELRSKIERHEQTFDARPQALIDLHVVAAAIFLDGKIMAAKRLAGGPSGLKWEFPGGKVEDGEHPEAALVREIDEELGMTITVREELGSYFTELGKWNLRLHCFICDAVSGPSKLEAHSEVSWYIPELLHEVDWALPDIPALEALRARLVA